VSPTRSISGLLPARKTPWMTGKGSSHWLMKLTLISRSLILGTFQLYEGDRFVKQYGRSGTQIMVAVRPRVEPDAVARPKLTATRL
jgi:hypothetical protein